MSEHPLSSPAANPSASAFPSRTGLWFGLVAVAGIPLSLLWDFSWESTVGVDLVYSPPHVATYVAVSLAGLTAISVILIASCSAAYEHCAVRIGKFRAPVGVWLSAWGALAYLAAFLFDQWWQSAYGLEAGIWHPPQILKTIAFFAMVIGFWLFSLGTQNQLHRGQISVEAVAFVVGGGLVLAMITVVTLVSVYPNRQHSAAFFRIACCTYPIVLVAVAMAGRLRWPATSAAAVYTLIIGATVWLLPIFPAKPQVPPIYNPLEHLMPPPFPLLLIAPAIGLDLMFDKNSKLELPGKLWQQAAAVGLMFFIVFFAAQWLFAEFLLSDLADNWFFAGGGRHWPFFLKIDSMARVSFWKPPQTEMNLANTVVVAALAMAAAYAGLWIGRWMKIMRR